MIVAVQQIGYRRSWLVNATDMNVHPTGESQSLDVRHFLLNNFAGENFHSEPVS
jgi:hypothetical protein